MRQRSASSKDETQPTEQGQSLGEYLAYIRQTRKMTLREVEEASGKEVSNAYLSQLENGAIKKPSPNILHALSQVYAVDYGRLMEKAGYVVARGPGRETAKHGNAATFADGHLTQEEEEELLRYLAFLRSKVKSRG